MSPRVLSGRSAGFLRWTLLVAIGLAIGPSPAAAQGPRDIPTAKYFATITDLYDQGEYGDALKSFQEEWRGAIKNVQSRWIDSICYHTMMGECYYQMGELDQALDQYTSALRLYALFPDWMIRVQFPASIRPSAANPQIPWGPSTRRALKGDFHGTMLISQGRIDNNQQYQQGGIVTPPILFPIHVQEILRCTCLAIRRRSELMGPLCQVDPVTSEVLSALSARPAPPNHWSQAWVDAELGLALVAAGRNAQALPVLNRALVAGGQFDHPLTGMVLFELGRLALLTGDNVAAARSFFEASIVAVQYPDAGLLEESLRFGAMMHLISNQRGVYPPLAAAGPWAKIKQLRQLQTSILLSDAENLAVLGQTPHAATVLDEATLAIGRRQMGAGRIGARLNFLRAMVFFQQRKIAQGDEAFNAAMTYMRHGSHWLYQVFQVDRLFTHGQITSRGPITPRMAMELYGALLRDPLSIDWSMRPMEALASISVPHPGSWEHWFLIALERKDHETALEISDRARRHRFFSSLGYGGRLQSLRWILEAPDAELNQVALLQRQNLLAQYPAYGKLSQQAKDLRAKLKTLPLVPKDNPAFLQQSQGLAQLAAISMEQEAVLREIAVRREPATTVFPPLKTAKEIQAALPSGSALLSFFAAGGDLYAFLMDKGHYSNWRVKSPALLMRKTSDMLREMGHYEQNRELTLKDLLNPAWKQTSRQLLDGLLAGSQADFSAKFPELVVVPDGFLWYVPFESLQVNVQDQLRPLISRFHVRYAPTVALAVPDGPGLNPAAQTAVVVGRLYPVKDPTKDANLPEDAFTQLSKSIPRCVALPSKPPLPAPSSVYASLMDRLIVLDDLVGVTEQHPYAWSPIQVERGKPGNTLDDWFLLPWGGPELVVLPGFHTAAENSLKRSGPGAPGMEIFFSVCGLMSTGAKTILLSRWRPGGQSSYDIVREFVQELPHTTPADAWQRAVLVIADTRLNPDAEPRIKLTSTDDPPRCNHPFFWAGYMLIDRGAKPEEADDDEPPVVKEDAAAGPPAKPAAAAGKPAAAAVQPVAAKPAAADPAEPEIKPKRPAAPLVPKTHKPKRNG